MNDASIVEYRRSTGKAVITRVSWYLALLRDHRHECLVKDRLGEPSRRVDRSNPRLVCPTGDFTPFDAHAVEKIGRRIDLVSYRNFGGRFLAMQLVASAETPHAQATTADAMSGGEGQVGPADPQ
ncbi:hypothetical protein KN815_08055 [Streptomyces sp. 4503]|uniref:Uncharacterized protein n=1 Tax=Streptomyces niphimycinicus TaxID=2842201 RepID=A0ABS6CAW7_9ACTN|nr:hypothetical protein [Streptomyces niphimycinicus]MBU3864034.1 hypothetical protein [Streptomyces niphimycinicus]